MLNLVAGTAGHIDHGKTSLVRALTGMDADRLEEEKRRGITIDIGFAHLQLTPEIRAGFVDVPGHERFVKNMLAGVGGIDVVLFVVAADDSIKPQTREHFEICRLLGIASGIVVLTKIDLVDADILELVKLEVAEFVAGSFLEDAPVVAVSAATGAGIAELKAELIAAAKRIRAKDAGGFARLPIDRAFSAKGFGTVVTGTLVSGAIMREQEVQLYPTERRLRVRGVQVFGKGVERAEAGQRTAVNLADIEPAEIARGMVLSEPGRFTPVGAIDCAIELLGSAKPLKHRAPVHFHAGTAEIEAQVRLFGGQSAIQPGAEGFARLVLREPALLLPGDRFIIRMFSPVTTIGGGRVIDIGVVKYRKADDVAARLRVLGGGDDAERVALLVRETVGGLSVRGLVARTGLHARAIRETAPGVMFLRAEDWLVDRAWFQDAKRRVVEWVGEFHRSHSLLPGAPKQSLPVPPHLLDELLRGAAELAVEGEIVRLRTHRLVLKDDEARARAAIEGAFESAGLLVPSVGEVLAKSGVEEKRGRSLLQILIREKRVIRIADDLVFHRAAVDGLRELLAARKGERFSVGDFKEWTGVSRKYAIPLLELLDRERVTRRDGDARVVL
jgi:selenocysteine-specific elongation factor